MKTFLKRSLNTLGFSMQRIQHGDATIAKDDRFLKLVEKCKPYTMTDVFALYELHKAVRYTVRTGLKGAFVECGVWRGGSSMMIALTLQDMEEFRDLILCDTFEGMSAPTKDDILVQDENYDVVGRWKKDKSAIGHNEWCYASIEDVHTNIQSTGYPMERVSLVKGKVEDTIPQGISGDIALLRLDTDWYESTKHELIHLYPKLQSRGCMIIDDYGAWAGAKKAVDEYFDEDTIMLHRINNSVRVMLKP